MSLSLLKSDPQHGMPLPLRLSQIVPDPEQPRKIFVFKETEELADSIQREGQETPVQVFKHPDPARRGVFMLSAGERRWRAFGIIAERTKTDPIVLAYIKIITDRKTQFRKAFLENLHRKDYHALDEAASYARLRRDGDSIEGIAELSGRSRTHVENYLKLHELAQSAKDLMDPNLPPEKQLSVTSAIDIAKSMRDPDLQLELAMEVVTRQLNVSDTRLLLGVRAEDKGYAFGGRFRKPSDDYKLFKSFIGKTRKAAYRFSQETLGRLYAFRDDEEHDRDRDILEIKNIQASLDKILKQLEEDKAHAKRTST